MIRMPGRRARLNNCSLAVLAALAFAPAAASQEAETGAQPQVEDEDVIVVTVERREQSLQDFAGTAVAFTGDELKQLGVQNFADLNGRYPGLQVANNQSNIEVFIRGVGSTNNTELGEPAAATHLDGVYIPRPSGFGSTFFDIQRVEVNVGPQGTLRGRNATAGSVNIIPFRPGLGIFDAAAEGGVGNFGQSSFEGVINVPVTQNSAFRLAGFRLEHDSMFTNVNPTSAELGVDVPTAESEGVGVAEAADNWGLRASYLIEPTNRLRVTLTGDFLSEEGTGYTGVNFANPLGNGVRPDEIDEPRRVLGRPITPDLDIEHWGVKAHVEYDGDWFDAEYIGGRRDLVTDFFAATPLGPFYPGVLDTLRNPVDGNLDEAFDNFSIFQSITDSESQVHEIRFFNEMENGTLWTAGAFYFSEDQRTFLGSTGDRTLFFSGQEFNQRTETDSWAIYGDATYPVTDRFRVTGGLRYSSEEKTRTGVNARYGFAIGGAGFSCCGGVRVGTEGFEFAGFDRTIFNPDTDGDGVTSDQEVLDFYFNGIAQFGARDNVDDIFADGPILGGEVRGPACLDTIVGDFFNCPSPNDDIFFDDFVGDRFTFAVPFQGQIAPQLGFTDFSFVDWRLRFEYDLSEENLLYFSLSTGHNGGGFNDNLPSVDGVTISPTGGTPAPFDTSELAPTFEEESVLVYEIGSKNEFDTAWGGGYFNASGFFYDYSDLIQNVLLSVGQVLNEEGLNITEANGDQLGLVVNFNFNASDARIAGAQFEAGFDLPYNLNWDGTLLWLPVAEITDSEPIADSRFQADVAPEQAIPQSIDGFRLRRTPKVSIQTSLSQKLFFDFGTADWIVSLGYRTEQNQDLFNGVIFPEFDFENDDPLRLDDRVEGYLTVDAGAGFNPGGDENLRIEAYVQNATDQERETAIIITQFDNTRFFTRPRTYGIRFRWRL